ncbi:MAG TPA: flagellar filament capping protein FliD [Clostridiales bacterium]|nr:flagellar filament capping protein FliD [Clostridiales bacterium]
MSYIYTSYNTTTRMTGLTGLDVDGLVYQLMRVERLKVDAVSRNRQLLVWKQEQYREIISALQNFSNEYFNALKPATDMRNSSIYNAFAVKYDGQDTNPYFSVSAVSGAKAGNYIIKNIVTAKTARILGSEAAGHLTGKPLGTLEINSDKGNNVFAVEFNGVKKTIILEDDPSDIYALKEDLQNKLDDAFGTGKISVDTSEDGTRLIFRTDKTNTLTFSNTTNNGYSDIFNRDLGSGIILTGTNNKFRVTVSPDGSSEEPKVKVIELPAGKYENAEDLAQVLRTILDNPELGFGENSINVKVENNKITLESSEPNAKVSISAVENGGLEAIGLDSDNNTGKINLNANIYDIRDRFAVPLAIDDENTEISFEINGQTFTFDAKTTSLSQLMAAVNSNTAAGVRMSYDSLNDIFILETKETGATARIMATDSSGGLLASLGLVTTEEIRGRDASITYIDPTITDEDDQPVEHVITRSTNSFSINGIAFTLQKDFAGEVELSVSSDPSKAVELIKGFVEKYNELLDKINTKLSEKREYDYQPLTDEQKEAMTEKEIESWEEKAKSGLLSGDNLLRAIVTGFRNAVIASVEGAGLTLADIGIRSNSWVDRGKLYVDEEKLKQALAANPNLVIDLFTKQSSVPYNSAVSNAAARQQRFNESGIIYRIYDVIQDNIRTTTINGHRGALLEKAGMIGDRSLYSNTLYQQIAAYDKKIAELNEELFIKENQYYIQFAQLERLINEMNYQSAWLAQQFMR